jgi:peptidoglycan/xylan/chitin deacetylase (PgdA/CDA1 family)
MKRTILFLILYASKYLGLFVIARLVTQRGLRILCYHGGSIDDEHRFSPGTFMTGATFRRRMAYIERRGFPVLGLDTAVRLQIAGSLPPCATVITFDDGWSGTLPVLFPVLRDFGFPATLYVTSYYVVKQTQVFNMFLQYLLWKHSEQQLDVSRVIPDSKLVVHLGSEAVRGRACEEILAYGDAKLDAVGRQNLAEAIGEALGHDDTDAEAHRKFRLVDLDELRDLAASGIDIQLHTHRHRLPIDRDAAIEEITTNRQVLEPVVGRRLRHLCYPSGNFSREHMPWLSELGIETATTTIGGFNYVDTPRLELRRFLDKENISQIEFEAELSGFFEIIRRFGIRI